MADDSIAHRLLRETCVRHVESRDEITSTNDHSLALIANNHDTFPAVVIAERQTTGRGRGSNRWWSGPGALTFSLILDAETAGFEVGSDPRTALLAGLAVADTLAEVVPSERVAVKWPNDVQVDGRKISGILVEIPPARRDLAVIGIGINVNNSQYEAPAELRETVTSLRDELGRDHCRIELLTRFLQSTIRTFAGFCSASDQLPMWWAQRCGLTGKHIAVQQSAETIRGHCRGIQPDGALLVETAEGLQTIRSANSVRVVNR